MDVNHIEYGPKRRLVRLCLFVLTPNVPLFIIFKSVRLTMKMKMMVENWRKTSGSESQETPSSAWMKINQLEKKTEKVEAALSEMKSTEASLEGTVQLFVLVCLFCIPFLWPKGAGLGPDFHIVNRTLDVWIFLVVSPIALCVKYFRLYAFFSELFKILKLELFRCTLLS